MRGKVRGTSRLRDQGRCDFEENLEAIAPPPGELRVDRPGKVSRLRALSTATATWPLATPPMNWSCSVSVTPPWRGTRRPSPWAPRRCWCGLVSGKNGDRADIVARSASGNRGRRVLLSVVAEKQRIAAFAQTQPWGWLPSTGDSGFPGDPFSPGKHEFARTCSAMTVFCRRP